MENTKKSIYEEITGKIITALQAGVNPWAKPWGTVQYGPFRNAVTKRPYRGMNILLLNLAACTRGYSDPRWLTFHNALHLGGHVRRSEKGTAIVFWKFQSKKDRDCNRTADALADEAEERKLIPFARSYTVFNAEQCEGLALPELAEGEAPTPGEYNELAEKVLSLPELKHGGNTACYLPQQDMVLLPDRSCFENDDFYYSTGFHEVCHWTGHASRLNRVFGTRFGDLAYAFEELVAEIGAAFLGPHTGIPFEDMRHPEYISQWLQILQGDNKAIFTAAAKAQNAADFILERAGIVNAQEEENTLPVAA